MRLALSCALLHFVSSFAAYAQDEFSAPPLSADEALKSFVLRPGFDIELVAAEPLVMDPVAFAWGFDGRLWVVEMGDYPLGVPPFDADGKGQPGGRVRFLDDLDGDGRYDRSTVFLDGLNFPTGVMPWRKGVLVAAAPEIFYAEDSDGDGRADMRKPLYVGFGEGNQQHRVNGLRWGLDNWIHCANGDSGGKIKSILTGKEVDISGRDFRIRPDTGEIDVQTGRSQFGRECDDWGNWFGTSNSKPLTHFVLPDEYLRRNPFISISNTTHEVPKVPGAAPIYPASKTLTRFNDFDRANRFTSACGPSIYRDVLFGEDFIVNLLPGDVVGNSFVCEPVHNLVHREVLEQQGSTFTSRRADDEQTSEFLASTDPWFRPVMTRTGPDGALWVADMYRLVIEHPQWIPKEWQAKLDLRSGHDRGRIYRVFPRDERPRAIPNLAGLESAALVPWLNHPSGTVRDLAHQRLIEQGGPSVAELLREQLHDLRPPQTTLHALAVLVGLNALTKDDVLHVLRDHDGEVCRHAIRLSERFCDDEAFVAELLKVDTSHPQVRLQLALTLGRIADPRAAQRLADFMSHADEEFLLAAATCSTHPGNVEQVLMHLLPRAGVEFAIPALGAPSPEVVTRLARLLSRVEKHDAAFVTELATALRPQAERGYDPWQLAFVNGLFAGLDALPRSWEQFQTANQNQLKPLFVEVEGVLSAASTLAENRQTDEVLRREAVTLLGRNTDRRSTDTQLLLELISPQQPVAVQQAAVAAVLRLRDASTSDRLLRQWNTLGPELRQQTLAGLLGQTASINLVLDNLAAGRLRATDLDATSRQRLMKHRDERVRRRAEELLAGAIDANRQKVIDAYRDVSKLAGNRGRGQEVFKKRCATCHKLGETGHAVGPDLLGLKDRSLSAMLTALFDPNRAVETKFVGYTAITTAGLTHTGLLVNETGASITLLGPDGKQIDVLRSELEELQSQGKSLMPEGLEKDLSPQDVADLLALLAPEQRAEVKHETASEPVAVKKVEAEEDDEEPKYRSGLVAHYVDAHGHGAVRRDADVQFVWDDRGVDPRLEQMPFTAAWRGRLFSIAPGKYQLHVYAAGHVRLHLENKSLLDAKIDQPAWLAAEPIDLTYGYHPLEIDYATIGAAPRISLFWSGPQFQLEPIPERHLFHLPTEAPSEQFEQGQLLTRALRCAACHELPQETSALTAPALDRVRGNLKPAWIVGWLSAKSPAVEGSVPRRMPHFDLSADDAQAVTAYLLATSAESPEPPKFVPPKADTNSKDKKKARTKPSVAAGERLVNTLGCLACHKLDVRGAQSLFGGGELTRIAEKRPPEFFARWLADPAAVNRAHRMPVFALSPLEQADIGLYLQTLQREKTTTQETSTNKSLVERGKQLVREHRCGSCHQLPEAPESRSLTRLRLRASPTWDASCLSAPEKKTHRPEYALNEAQRSAVRAYLGAAKKQSDGAPLDGAYVLAERNCLACHARGLAPGITEYLSTVTQRDAELGALLPSLAPPSLNGVGDKLQDAALAAAIELRRPPLRPWLAIRMPKFKLSHEELVALTQHFVDHDRVPDLPQAEPVATADGAPQANSAQQIAARRLVTSDGFGCTSCHKIGNSEPVKVALNAHGTDLTMLGERIRRPWYDRWVRNPARIVPRMEMPAIQLPVRGVLHDNVHEQLAAVWNTLNTPGFNPPPPGPVRIVRARNVPALEERDNVLTDVLEIGDKVFTRPVLIGLPNRHNVLFDLEAGRLVSWWIGDTALQRTRGKSWYWTAGGEAILSPTDQQDSWADLDFDFSTEQGVDVRSSLRPAKAGQWTAQLDWVEQHKQGIRFGYRLSFASGATNESLIDVTIVETIGPTAQRIGLSETTGFTRRIELIGARPKTKLTMQPLPGFFLKRMANDTKLLSPIRFDGKVANPTEFVRVLTGDLEDRGPLSPPGDHFWMLSLTNEHPVCEIACLSTLPIDQFPITPPALPKPTAVKLDVVPGYEAIQLPLPSEYMPTGLAWRADGTLVFCSLKGQVCSAHDTNDDGLEDDVRVIADGLPAPYGIAANEDGTIDVLCKYGLVRLSDFDQQGRAQRTTIAADGWGMTADYHDWAVGLPKDRDGNYLVALPCQQDDRDEAAARFRGQLLRLSPHPPTHDNPRLFTMEPVCGGLRFPMGLAVNRRGDIFASDNQGNYNPFNEVNHLRPGLRYGFINKLEKKADFHPPEETAAIALPHPWTRSVNGLCFMETPNGGAPRPEGFRPRLAGMFGAFEGHLLGCEYTTLQLIRMTLDSVGDTYEGAAYPLSRAPQKDEPTFEGPVVAAVSPRGDMYVGNVRDSGWGGGQNTGSIVRLRPSGELPVGIRRVTATVDGFSIEFTGSLDRRRASDPKQYSVISYRRVSTPAYGGDNSDERTERVRAATVSTDARQVTLHLSELQSGRVYELRVGAVGVEGQPLHPAEAYYTRRGAPASEVGSQGTDK